MHITRRPNPADDARKGRQRIGVALAAGMALAALVTPSLADADAGGGQAELAEVRAATAAFHRIEVSEAAGYQLGWKNPDIPITGCVAHPTGVTDDGAGARARLPAP